MSQEEQYVRSTAAALGLPHGAEDAEQILLFQMPSVLPEPRRAGPPPDPGPHGHTPAAAPAAGIEATPFEELPPGKVKPSGASEQSSAAQEQPSRPLSCWCLVSCGRLG